MEFATLFLLLKISLNISILVPGIVFPFIRTNLVFTVLGLFGLMDWADFVATDPSLAYYAFGFSYLLNVIVFIFKLIIFGFDKTSNPEENDDDKENMPTTIYNYLFGIKPKGMVKIDFSDKRFWVWCIFMNIFFIGDLAFFHWFTTNSTSIFWWSMLSLIGVEFVVLCVFFIIFFGYDWYYISKKNPVKTITSDGNGLIEMIWFILQLPIFNFCIWGAYEGFYKTLGWQQTFSMLASGGIYIGVNVILIIILYIIKLVVYGRNMLKKDKNDVEMEDYSSLGSEDDM